MIVTVPDSIINTLWGFIGAVLLAGTAFLYSLKSKFIPLEWKRKKTMDTMGEYLTAVEFDSKLRDHCSRRQLELTSQLNKIFDSINKLNDATVDIRERIARIEGANSLFRGDHK